MKHRKAAALIATSLALGLIAAVAAPTLERAGALACYTTLTCNPANIPMIVESGVIAGTGAEAVVGAAATTAPVVATGSAANVWANLAVVGGAFTGIFTIVELAGGIGTAQGGLSSDGLYGQRVRTDESLGAEISFVGGTATLEVGGYGTFTATIGLKAGARQCVVGSWSGGSGTSAYFEQTEGPAYGYSESAFAKDNVYDPCKALYPAGTLLSGFGPTGNYGQPVVGWRIRIGSDYSDPVAGTYGGTVTGTAEVTLRCQSLDDGSVRTVTGGLHQSFEAGSTMTVPDVGCAPGEIAVGADIDWNPDTGDSQQIVHDDGSQVLPQLKEAPDDYPGCFTATGPNCLLILEKLRAGGGYDSCGQIGELCEDWVTDPQRDTNYRCRYGVTVVGLDYCSAYRKPSIGVLPNVAPDGSLLSPDAPVPSIQTPGTVTEPGTEVEPEPDTVDCRPASWLEALNPYWVFRAVQCVVEWAVKPPAGKLEQFRAEVLAKFAGSPPGKIAAALIPLTLIPIASDGCSGVTIDLTWLRRDAFATADFPDSFTILQACPGDTLQPFAIMSTLVIIVGMGFVAFRTWPALIGRIFTYSGVDG